MRDAVQVAGRQAWAALQPSIASYVKQSSLAAGTFTDTDLFRIEASMAAKFTDATRAVFVVADDDVVHGFAILHRVSGSRDGGAVATIEDMWVAPESRGTTEAAKLLHCACFEMARADGCRWLDAVTEMANHHVGALLMKRHFRPVRTVYTRDLEEAELWAAKRAGKRKRGKARGSRGKTHSAPSTDSKESPTSSKTTSSSSKPPNTPGKSSTTPSPTTTI